MEEDTGKSLHVGGATGRIHGAEHSLVDYNRAGVPLIEIVTKPVVGTGARAPEVARAYVTALRDLLRALGVSDVRMEQGSLRCDVNVSLMPTGSTAFGTRTETKNVNSLRSVERAVRYEITRQAAVLLGRRAGRAGDPALRRGDRHHVARPAQGDRRGLPVLPRARPRAGRAGPGVGRGAARRRCPSCPGCAAAAPGRVGAHRPRDARPGQRRRGGPRRGDRRRRAPPAEARSWWVAYLAQQANSRGVELAELAITPAQVARVVALVASGALNDKLARQVVDGVLAGEGEPDEVVAARGLAVVSDDSALVAAVDEALAAPAGRRREDPRRQGRGRRGDRRRGHEGDQGPGRRQAGAGAGPRAGRPRRLRSGSGVHGGRNQRGHPIPAVRCGCAHPRRAAGSGSPGRRSGPAHPRPCSPCRSTAARPARAPRRPAGRRCPPAGSPGRR